MPTSSQKRKSGIDSLIYREKVHFQLESAKLIKAIYETRKQPVPEPITHHIEHISGLFKSKGFAKETRCIQVGKEWVKDFIESSATFGRNTNLIRVMQAERARRQLDKERFRRESLQQFSNPDQQYRYVSEQMRNWTFNDPVIHGNIQETVTEFCPTYHRQYQQQYSNMANAVIRAFEVTRDMIREVQPTPTIVQDRTVQPKATENSTYNREDHSPTARFPLGKDEPHWPIRPRDDQMADVLRNPCNDDFDDDSTDTTETTKPTPVAKQEKYVQTEFPFMQRIRQ